MLFFTTLCGLFTLICAKEVPKFLFIHERKKTVWSGKPVKPAGYRSKPAGLPDSNRTEAGLNLILNSAGYRPVTGKPGRFTATGGRRLLETGR
jgi:hypothetical protein